MPKRLTISLKDAGIDWEHIAQRYPDIDLDYAETCDLTCPILFVPWKGVNQLIDGWHRLATAVLHNVDELPAYVLTAAERDSIMREVRE